MARGGKPGGGGSGSGGSVPTIKGTGGNDLLSDGGAASILVGRRGDDVYLVANAGTVIEELAGEGIDEVRTSLDWTLAAWVEKLTLTGTTDATGTGNELDNVLVGNGGDNALFGLAGDDLLDGGDGNDTLGGGAGDDTLIGGAGSDVAVFSGNAADHDISREGDQIWVVRGTERDVLLGIETLSFADGDINAAVIGSEPPAPVAVADDGAGLEDTAVTIAVLDNDLGDGIAVATATNGAKGLVTVNADGTVTYRPNAHAHGEDSFTYTITDSMGRPSSATVTLTIAAVNDAPVAANDSLTATAGTTAAPAWSVLANDSDVDGDTLSVAAYDATSAAGGTVAMAADGTFTYTPAAGFSGTDSFTYTAADGRGGEATATVAVTVEPPPDPDALPYYIDALLPPEEAKRLNYPDPVGTPVTVTYTFLEAVPSYYGSAAASIGETFRPFSSQQREATRAALAEIERFTNVTFVEVASPEEATITFGLRDLGDGTLGSAWYPIGTSVGTIYSDVWIDTEVAGDTFIAGTPGFFVLLHELGHALGLEHPALPISEDNRQHTVMDYSAHPTMGGDVTGYQLFDIAALQYLYGADTDATAGDDVYGFSALDGIIRTLWDAGGHDVLDLSDSAYAVALNLNAGTFSTVSASGSNNVALAFGTVIEDAVGGAFDDVIIGNPAANRIEGGAGDDTLTGGGGGDVFVFGTGWGADTVTDFARGEDLLDLSASGLTMQDLEITSESGSTRIAYGGEVIVLLGVATVDGGDFLFAAA